MSALGQKWTCAAQKVMSALPSKADVCGAIWDVCFVPKADIGGQSIIAGARQRPRLGDVVSTPLILP
jgi:hypothetical protein